MNNYIIIDELVKDFTEQAVEAMAILGRSIAERSNVEWYIIPYRIDPYIPYYKKCKKKNQQ